MNERIKELMNQAGIDVEAVENLGEMPTALKFAELIVKECAELIDNKVMITAPQTYDEVFVAVYNTNFANAKKIKEHFGVEE